jgi:hypothetical protein
MISKLFLPMSGRIALWIIASLLCVICLVRHFRLRPIRSLALTVFIIAIGIVAFPTGLLLKEKLTAKHAITGCSN